MFAALREKKGNLAGGDDFATNILGSSSRIVEASVLWMTRETPMTPEKMTSNGKKFITKNLKATASESPASAKKAAKKTTKKAPLKNAFTKKNKTTSKAADIPAFFPKYAQYRLSDIVSTIEYRKDPMGGGWEEVWEEDSDGEEWYAGEQWCG